MHSWIDRLQAFLRPPAVPQHRRDRVGPRRCLLFRRNRTDVGRLFVFGVEADLDVGS